MHRGVIQCGIQNSIHSKWAVVLIMGLLFGAFHLSPVKFLGTGILGAVMSWILLSTDSMVYSSFFHFFHNGLQLVLLMILPGVLETSFFGASAFQDDLMKMGSALPVYALGLYMAIFGTAVPILIYVGNWLIRKSLAPVKPAFLPKGKEKITGWESPLLPETLLQQHFFPDEVEELHQKRLQAEQIQTELDSQEEEQLGEDGFFFQWEKVDLAALKSRIKEIKGDLLRAEELAFLRDFLARKTSVNELKSDIKTLETKLNLRTRQACDALTEDEGKMIVVNQKWLASLRSSIHEDAERVMHTFAQQLKILADRYATPLPEIEQNVVELKDRVTAHLQKMGLTWEGSQR